MLMRAIKHRPHTPTRPCAALGISFRPTLTGEVRLGFRFFFNVSVFGMEKLSFGFFFKYNNMVVYVFVCHYCYHLSVFKQNRYPFIVFFFV